MGEREYLQQSFQERTVTRPIDKAVSEIANLKKSIDIIKVNQMKILSQIELILVAQKELKESKPETGGWIFS